MQQCEICQRPASTRLPFNCTLCARDVVYRQRVQIAQTLLQRERIGKEVEQATCSTIGVAAGGEGPNTLRTIKPAGSKPNLLWTVQRSAAEQVAVRERTDLTLRHIEILREEIQKTRHDIAERKARSHRRRSDFAAAKRELLQSQANDVDPVEKSIRRAEHRWELLHDKTAESRFFLCREAALLYGLQQRKRRKGGLGRDIYYIGSVPIPDLRDLNSMPSSLSMTPC